MRTVAVGADGVDRGLSIYRMLVPRAATVGLCIADAVCVARMTELALFGRNRHVEHVPGLKTEVTADRDYKIIPRLAS